MRHMTAPRVVHAVHASAIGAAHAARGHGNEDAVAVRRTPHGGVTAAVADGHSDPRCTRARRGADLAVGAVVEASTDAGGGFGSAVVARWRAAVDADRTGDPTAEPLPRIAYGTTLLACRSDERGVAILQAGDGDVVVVDRAGEASRPLRSLDRLVAPPGATASLADDDILDVLVETWLPPEPAPRIVLLASDGLDNAYPRDGALLEAAAEIVEREDLRDRRVLQREVDDWVARAAATSGDDASVVVIVLSEVAP